MWISPYAASQPFTQHALVCVCVVSKLSAAMAALLKLHVMHQALCSCVLYSTLKQKEKQCLVDVWRW